MSNLVAIDKVEIRGETIKQVIFVNIGGGEKTILIFESGKILIMPVYKKCPVQFGAVDDFRGDLPNILQSLENMKQQTIEEADSAISLLKEL